MQNQAQRGDRTPTPPPPVLSFEPIQDPRVNPRACQVLWALARWAWGSKPYCWPTNQQIADLIGCGQRTVVVALKQLEDAGYIKRHMVRSSTGWYRSIVITDRVQPPKLAIVEPPAPPAETCATPPQKPARPLAQKPAREGIENLKEEKRKLAEPSSPKEGARLGQSEKQEGEPAWLKVDNLTSAEVEHWRAVAAEPGPFGRIARKIVERIDRGENASASGSRRRSPEADADGNASQRGNSSRNPASGQDK
jgi:hypothetical protein